MVDVNDNKLIFIDFFFNYFFEWVLLFINFGIVVFKVVVIDDDIGMNVEVFYSIVGGNIKGLFMIE